MNLMIGIHLFFFFKETAKMLSRVIVSFSKSDCPHPCQHLVLPLFLF